MQLIDARLGDPWVARCLDSLIPQIEESAANSAKLMQLLKCTSVDPQLKKLIVRAFGRKDTDQSAWKALNDVLQAAVQPCAEYASHDSRYLLILCLISRHLIAS